MTIVATESHNYNQNNPNIFWSGQSYLITWEDERNSAESPDQDIYLQLIEKKKNVPILFNYCLQILNNN